MRVKYFKKSELLKKVKQVLSPIKPTERILLVSLLLIIINSLTVHLTVSNALNRNILLSFPKVSSEFEFHHISEAPYRITKPGYYRLVNNIYTKSEGITIESDDVTLDLNGYTIDGSSAGTKSEYSGVYSVGKRDITITGGAVTGFKIGIYILDNYKDLDNTEKTVSGGCTIENMRLERNLVKGIWIHAREAKVRNNVIKRTTGTTLDTNYRTFGIEALGPGIIIENNHVINTVPVGKEESVGISISGKGKGSVIRNNTISNSSDIETGRSFGVWVGGSDRGVTNVAVLNNVVVNMMVGLAASSPVNGVYRENIVLGAEENYYVSSKDFVDGGNNYGSGPKGNTNGVEFGRLLPDFKR